MRLFGLFRRVSLKSFYKGFLFLFLWCIFPRIYGQYDDLKFQWYSVKEGLVHNMINKMLMDKDGFLWIATEGGLSRFDGVSFTNFNLIENPQVKLPSLSLNDLDYDGNRLLWIATDAGLVSLDIKTFQLNKNYPILLKEKINRICLDKEEKKLWFVTEKSDRLYSFYTTTNRVDSFVLPGFTAYYTQEIVKFNNKLFFAVERNAFFSFDLVTKKMKRYRPDCWPFRLSIVDNKLYGLIWQENNYEYDKERDSFLSLPMISENARAHFDMPISSGMSSAPFLKKEEVLICTNTSGLIIYNVKEKKTVHQISKNYFYKDGIKSDFFNTLYKDKYNNIWMGSWGGFCKINSTVQYKSGDIDFLQTRAYNLLAGMLRDQKNKDVVWYAATGFGIIEYNKRTKQKVKHYFNNVLPNGEDLSYKHRWVEFMQIDENNTIWGGGYTGLVSVQNGVEKIYDFKHKSNYIFALNLYRENPETFWVSTGQGLVKFNPQTGNYKWIYLNDKDKEFGSNNVNNVFPLGNNQLLATGYVASYIYNSATGSKKRIEYVLKDKSTFNRIFSSVYNRKEKILYLAGNTGVYYKRDKELYFQKVEGNLPIIPVERRSIWLDKNGILWIYTAQALYSFNPVQNKILRFDQKDGIYNNINDPPSFFEFEDEIYIGHRGAFTKFNPNLVASNKEMANPVFTGLAIDGKNVYPDFDLYGSTYYEIKPGFNSIRVDFTGIQYISPERIKFLYFLEGISKEWIATSERFLNFNNLEAGKYVLKIKAVNSSGIVNEKYATFYFRIIPAFYQTWWFKILIFLLILAIVLLIYFMRIKRIQDLYSVRNKLSRDLHDNIGATISSAGYSTLLLKNNLEKPDVREKLIQKIQKDIKNVGESLDEIVWSINPLNDNWEKLIARMRRYGADLLESSDIHYQFKFQENIPSSALNPEARKEIYLIYKEALNNVIKHAGATEVTVKLEQQQGQLILEICDDGRGFNQNLHTDRNGLLNMQQRALQIHGKLEITSLPGNGCIVMLKLKV